MKQHLSKVLFWAECCSRLLVLKPPSSPQTWLLPNGSSAVCLSPPLPTDWFFLFAVGG